MAIDAERKKEIAIASKRQKLGRFQRHRRSFDLSPHVEFVPASTPTSVWRILYASFKQTLLNLPGQHLNIWVLQH